MCARWNHARKRMSKKETAYFFFSSFGVRARVCASSSCYTSSSSSSFWIPSKIPRERRARERQRDREKWWTRVEITYARVRTTRSMTSNHFHTRTLSHVDCLFVRTHIANASARTIFDSFIRLVQRLTNTRCRRTVFKHFFFPFHYFHNKSLLTYEHQTNGDNEHKKRKCLISILGPNTG